MRTGILLIAAATCLCGCSDGTEGRKPVYAASGKVTLSGGAPISGATISFAPLDGQPVAIGKTDDAGVYTLTTYDWQDGAAAGKFNVLITKTIAAPGPAASSHDAKQAGSGAPSHDAKKGAGGGGESMLNPKYSKSDGGLQAEVKTSGTNEFNFDLDP